MNLLIIRTPRHARQKATTIIATELTMGGMVATIYLDQKIQLVSEVEQQIIAEHTRTL